MQKTIQIPTILLLLGCLVLGPKLSYAWGDQQGRDDGRSNHEGRFHEGRAHEGYYHHAYRNPDLTLISGMDAIDNGVLIAADVDTTPTVIEEPIIETTETVPVGAMGPDLETFTVNVPNNAGGFTPVIIKRWGNGYLGPQGEFYYPFPQVSQLKAMYGI